MVKWAHARLKKSHQLGDHHSSILRTKEKKRKQKEEEDGDVPPVIYNQASQLSVNVSVVISSFPPLLSAAVSFPGVIKVVSESESLFMAANC